MTMCERCSHPYDAPLNRPTWALCMACTLNPAGRYNRKATGIAPGYALPAPTLTSCTFIVPGRPVSVNRAFVGRTFRYTNEIRQWRSNVRAHALQGLGPLAHKWDKSRRFTIEIAAYFATNRSDSDNVIKPVKDSLQDERGIKGSGIFYFNDSQVISDLTHKHVDPVAPRLVVTVKAVE